MLEVSFWPSNSTGLPVLSSPTNPLLRPPQACWSVVISRLVTSPPLSFWLGMPNKGIATQSFLSRADHRSKSFSTLYFSDHQTVQGPSQNCWLALTGDSDVKSDWCLLSTHSWSKRLAGAGGNFPRCGNCSEHICNFLNLQNDKIKICIFCQVNQTSIKLIKGKQEPNVIIPQNRTRLPLCSDSAGVLTPSSVDVLPNKQLWWHACPMVLVRIGACQIQHNAGECFRSYIIRKIHLNNHFFYSHKTFVLFT